MTTAGPAKIRSMRSTLASIATMIDGANSCASAAEAGRRPSNHALRAVGIDGRHWDLIGRR
ncbi:hypothetical protein GCM10011390_18490 [Aureimonas endophytica]|uniref:Uncharacterized protein n=1 Tax=Aureimonas endophytica TaxID=2027858 RepID=A0A916ZJA5_9HYPH|nr:hypothetical protein [Aureimonas endophytica]GGE00003.1 hypothetical protein GCM10011390_18490 [Aureimonas endophytica]